MCDFEFSRRLAACVVGFFVLTLCGFAVAVPQHSTPSTPRALEPVNAVLGDESFVQTFARPPRVDEEHLRLQTHLRYVEQTLRSQAPAGLTEAQQKARAHELDELGRYWRRGRFPTNRVSSKRMPILVDDDGVHCAVAFLMKDDVDSQVMAEFVERHLYDYLSDVKAPILEDWARQKGFSARELAMIQPTYGEYYRGFFDTKRRRVPLAWVVLFLLIFAIPSALVIYEAQRRLGAEDVNDAPVPGKMRAYAGFIIMWAGLSAGSNVMVIWGVRRELDAYRYITLSAFDEAALVTCTAFLLCVLIAATFVPFKRTNGDATACYLWARRMAGGVLALALTVVLSAVAPLPLGEYQTRISGGGTCNYTAYTSHLPLWVTGVTPFNALQLQARGTNRYIENMRVGDDRATIHIPFGSQSPVFASKPPGRMLWGYEWGNGKTCEDAVFTEYDGKWEQIKF